MAVTTYEDWLAHAAKEDRRSGADRWRSEERSTLYDYKVIRYRYDELVNIRRSGDPTSLLYYLNEGLHGNMGGIGSPLLYKKALSGTKTLIDSYLSELVAALDDLEQTAEKEISRQEKLAYFRRAATCFGRSALMFSGAGSLGAFHLGVARELAEHGLIPRVISGASAGSIVAAVIGTHVGEDLLNVLDQNNVIADFEALHEGQSAASRTRQVSQTDLISMIESIIPDLTFGEAHALTGRNLNVSVAPSQLHQRSRMLNASTAPNAYIREAVLASCAIPGVFPAVDADGERRR